MRALAIAALVAACSTPSEHAPGVDVERALAHVAVLARTPRPQDSPASRAAADYIAAQRVVTTDPNLIVRFGPRGRALVIMAHYDSVATSPGAIDNAAAVGVLIELARVLAASPPPFPVMLVFTANEEIGLVGAEALAGRHGDEIDFAIALDLIGGTGALALNGVSELIGRTELRWLAAAAERAGVVVRAPLAHRVISRWWPQAERSDHGPFTRRKIRALHFYHRGNDGEWIDLAYHSPADVAARVHRHSVAELGRLLRALTATPIPAHDGDGFWLPVAHGTVVPRWTLLASCFVLAALAIAFAFGLRGPRVVRGGLGLLAGIACYALAFGATVAVEPARWIQSPLRVVIAESLVFAGVFGLAVTLAGRFRPWTGERRYLAIAIAVPLGFGLVLVAIGAAELAWIWLVPAAVAALAPRLGRARIVIAIAVLPLVLVLDPDQLREAAWNGFLPTGMPLAGWLGLLGIPVVAAAGWLSRCRSQSGPLGTLVIPVGCLVAGILGIGLARAIEAPCSRAQFLEFGLACEMRARVH